MSQEPLNAQQMADLQKRFEARVQAAIECVGLRKYALDLACQHSNGGKPAEIIASARAMYEFLTEPSRQP